MKKLQLLPIGSVVLLEGAEKRLMICGRIQTDTATGTTYDYSGCLYPDGIIDSSQIYMSTTRTSRPSSSSASRIPRSSSSAALWRSS